MPSDKAKRAAAARLKKLDQEAAKETTRRKKNVLRTKVQMGDRKTRRKAASELSQFSRNK